MVDFMELYHSSVEYDRDKTFTKEEIPEIDPVEVKRWLANKEFQNPDFDMNRGDQPIHIHNHFQGGPLLFHGLPNCAMV